MAPLGLFRRLLTLMLTSLVVSGSLFGITEAIAARTTSAAPAVPVAAQALLRDPLASIMQCPAAARAAQGPPRGLTYDEAISCCPSATISSDGHMHHDGVFLVQEDRGGYRLESRKTFFYDGRATSGARDAAASTYQYVVLTAGTWSNWTQVHISSQSDNDVWWGNLDDAAAYNRFIGVGCDYIFEPGGYCQNYSSGTLYPVYPYYMNPWVNVWYVHRDSTTFEMGCRHYINAAEQWTDAWCFSNG